MTRLNKIKKRQNKIKEDKKKNLISSYLIFLFYSIICIISYYFVLSYLISLCSKKKN